VRTRRRYLESICPNYDREKILIPENLFNLASNNQYNVVGVDKITQLYQELKP